MKWWQYLLTTAGAFVVGGVAVHHYTTWFRNWRDRVRKMTLTDEEFTVLDVLIEHPKHEKHSDCEVVCNDTGTWLQLGGKAYKEPECRRLMVAAVTNLHERGLLHTFSFGGSYLRRRFRATHLGEMAYEAAKAEREKD